MLLVMVRCGLEDGHDESRTLAFGDKHVVSTYNVKNDNCYVIQILVTH